jgi:hypothetical protein
MGIANVAQSNSAKTIRARCVTVVSWACPEKAWPNADVVPGPPCENCVLGLPRASVAQRCCARTFRARYVRVVSWACPEQAWPNAVVLGRSGPAMPYVRIVSLACPEQAWPLGRSGLAVRVVCWA